MKILVLGDFHGKFPAHLKKIAKAADVIFSTGDFSDLDFIRKIIFKNWSDKPWYEVVGLKKAKILEKKGFDSGLKVIQQLNSLGKKVYTIWGNTDFYKRNSTPGELHPGYYDDAVKKLQNVSLIDRKKKNIHSLEVVGHGGYLDVTDFIKHPIDKDDVAGRRRLERYRREERKLLALFEKYHPKPGFIFLIHYPAYGYFDLIQDKKNPMYQRHVGWEPYNTIIKKYKPGVVLCGHMHEYQGKKMLGNSIIVATGAAKDGRAVVLNVEKGMKPKIIFIKAGS